MTPISRTTRLRFAMVLLLAGSGCQPVDPSEAGSSIAPSDSPTSPQATPESSSSAPAIDLTTILVAPASPPAGTAHDYTTEGVVVLTRPVVSGRTSEFFDLDGFTAGRYETFSGDLGLFMSLGLLFDSATYADAAFELYLDELLSDHGYAATVTSEGGLGDEGLCAEFDNPSLGGIHEDACLWRNGSLVLIAGGTLQPEAILLQAQAMDQRASAPAGY